MRSSCTQLKCACDFQVLAEKVPALQSVAPDLASFSRDRIWLKTETDPVEAVAPILDSLAGLDLARDAESLGNLLPLLVDWCRYDALELFPDRPLTTVKDLPQKPDKEVEWVYDSRPPRQIITVNYGLRRDDQTKWQRPWSLRASYGPEPSGYRELQEVLAGCGEAVQPLLDKLKTWPSHNGPETFFVDYWELRYLFEKQPDRQRLIDDKLKFLLKSVDRFVFYPEKLESANNGWKILDRPDGAPRGKSFGWIRPGLKDGKGTQKVPPIVWTADP